MSGVTRIKHGVPYPFFEKGRVVNELWIFFMGKKEIVTWTKLSPLCPVGSPVWEIFGPRLWMFLTTGHPLSFCWDLSLNCCKRCMTNLPVRNSPRPMKDFWQRHRTPFGPETNTPGLRIEEVGYERFTNIVWVYGRCLMRVRGRLKKWSTRDGLSNTSKERSQHL